MQKRPPTIRLAKPADAMSITILYQRVYSGNYTNPLMRDIAILTAFLQNKANLWVVVEESGDSESREEKTLEQNNFRLIGSVVYETDPTHRLARAFGGVVLSEYRGGGLLEQAMKFAQNHLMDIKIDVVYATTRTSSQAPQIVTQHLGYKKLGIFPNVHKTETYETHCLTALFGEQALEKRKVDFGLHPRIRALFEIVQQECSLPNLPEANPDDLALDSFSQTIDLELITAEKYATHRYESQRTHGLLHAHFYPFHSPNMVISSPCQTVEIFLYVASSDKHCTIMGVKKPREYNFTELLNVCSSLLSGIGVRYIEILVRADKAKTLERVMKAKFVPCAYFPAFQKAEDFRFDFVVLARTFEILDFSSVKLTGKNRVYLDQYIQNIQEYFLQPKSSD